MGLLILYEGTVRLGENRGRGEGRGAGDTTRGNDPLLLLAPLVPRSSLLLGEALPTTGTLGVHTDPLDGVKEQPNQPDEDDQRNGQLIYHESTALGMHD
jgi:hypothetical protein